jgi:hypothetical protein
MQIAQNLQKTARDLLGRRLGGGRARVPALLAKVAVAAKLAGPFAAGSTRLQQRHPSIKPAQNQGGWNVPQGFGYPAGWNPSVAQQGGGLQGGQQPLPPMLAGNHRQFAGETDIPIGGLLTDLKQRGLLDSTLVIWGGEFGRYRWRNSRTTPSRWTATTTRTPSRPGSRAAAYHRPVPVHDLHRQAPEALVLALAVMASDFGTAPPPIDAPFAPLNT